MLTYTIDKIFPDLKMILRDQNTCILAAPPGAGKTTRIPLTLISEPWLNNSKIVMLEPRRLAVRRAAEFMAKSVNERCGESVGYRIRSEAVISNKTRIEVVTEGILTRMLQSDPELPGCGLIIFDEFHERSIHADTGLAFLLDAQKHIRPDIKILLMSATPDLQKLSSLLNNPPVIISEGKVFPVETHYQKTKTALPVEMKTAEAVISALRKEDGDILVFLPGKKEIKQTNRILEGKINNTEVIIHELYGDAPREQQDESLKPSSEKRKVILATSIAETSLTIDGIRIVIDSGVSRLPFYNIRRGMPGLITVPVSKASADQRRGRAGRQQSGVCYRLWSIEEDLLHPDFTEPEILSIDLTPLALELAKWGNPDAEGLAFPDPPSRSNLQKARSILFMLGAVDNSGRLSSFGKKMYSLSVHPRLSAMILRAKEKGLAAEACLLAALLEDRELPGKGNMIDLSEQIIQLMNQNSAESRRIFEQAGRLRRLINIPDTNKIKELKTGLMLAFAYPDRIAKKISHSRYQLVQGTTAIIAEDNPLAKNEYLVVADIDGSNALARIFLASSITRDDLLEVFRNDIVIVNTVEWINDSVKGIKRNQLGSIVLQEKEYKPSSTELQKVILQKLNSEGLNFLYWSKEAVRIRSRSEWYRNVVLGNRESDWPVLSDDYLINNAADWLSPFLINIYKKTELDKLKLDEILKSLFTHEQLKYLQIHVPDSIKVPGGSNIRINYEGEKPVIAVKLQELFGQTDTPVICNGRVPLLIHLLTPAMRPLAITQDLHSFWINVYPMILKQMRVKYPKHVWPDNPLSAAPTNKTK